MKHLFRSGFLIVMLGFCLPRGFAGVISGTISGSLSVADSPFFVDGDITVPSGMRLTIDPGVSLVMGGSGTRINIDGELKSLGTAENPVVFHGAVVGCDTLPWDGIRFVNCTTPEELNFTYILNANNPIYSQSSSLSLSNCAIFGKISCISLESSTINIDSTYLDLRTNQIQANGIDARFSKVIARHDTMYISASGIDQQANGIKAIGGFVNCNNSRITVQAQNINGLWFSQLDSARIAFNIFRLGLDARRASNCNGIYMTMVGSTIRIYNNTFAMSSLFGSNGVYTIDNRGSDIRNNIFIGQVAGSGIGNGAYDRRLSFANWDYNLLYHFSMNYTNAPSGQHDLTGLDPMLDPVTLIPCLGSPVINAGDPTLPHDPDNSTADMGAVPYIFSSVRDNPAIPSAIGLTAYPNPFNGNIRFTVPTSGKVEWRVVDRLGRTVSSGIGTGIGGEFSTQWHPQGLSSGWYNLEIKTEKGFARRTLCYLR